jgi:hypothetical protein
MRLNILLASASSWAQRIIAGLGRHRLQLLIVLLASLIGQILTLTQTPLAVQLPDSATFLAPAHHILTSFQLFDPIRPPGYPLFLTLPLLLGGGQTNPTIIVLAQAALMVLCAGEIYLLAYRLTRSQWAAAIAGAIFGSNLAILQWERAVLVGAFDGWLTLTIFVILESHLRAPKTWKIVTMGILLGFTVLASPANLVIPPIVFGIVLVRDLRLRQLRRTWLGLGIAVVLAVGIVEGYIQENGKTTGLYALTDVTNVNLLGKILEYRMQDENTNPRFAQLQQQLDAYVQAHQGQAVIDPYGFVDVQTEFDVPYFNPIGDYSSAIISHHPIEFFVKSIPDVQQTWLIDPSPLLSSPTPGPLTQLLFNLATLELWEYILLPFLLVVLAIWFFLRPRNRSIAILFALMATLAANILISALGSYGDFYRLRSPLDWAMVLGGSVVVVELARSLQTGQLTYLWTGQTGDSSAYSIQRHIEVFRREKITGLAIFGGVVAFIGIAALIVLLMP